jgi:Carboxypeptidase regulatory-like domain
MRVLAAAIYSILLTLPAIASSAPALTADAAAKQQGSSSSLPPRAPVTLRVMRAVDGWAAEIAANSRNHELHRMNAFAYSASTQRLTPAVDAEGGISGTVTAAADGAKLSNVDIEIFNGSGDSSEFAGSASTGADGTYQVTGLDPAARSYRVCFDAGRAAGGSSPLGYASQCYRGVPWDYGAPALGAMPVPVTAGRLTPAVDAALSAAGGISGTVTVTAAADGAKLSNVEVRVFNGSGDFEGSATTGADGTYQVTGLTPAAPGYSVCFDASGATGGCWFRCRMTTTSMDRTSSAGSHACNGPCWTSSRMEASS